MFERGALKSYILMSVPLGTFALARRAQLAGLRGQLRTNPKGSAPAIITLPSDPTKYFHDGLDLWGKKQKP